MRKTKKSRFSITQQDSSIQENVILLENKNADDYHDTFENTKNEEVFTQNEEDKCFGKSGVSRTNKGYELLCKKFGYREGSGLGKFNQGIIEPILISKRDFKDMSGIGTAELERRKQIEAYAKLEQAKVTRENMERKFIQNSKQNFIHQNTLRYLRQAENTIHELDSKTKHHDGNVLDEDNLADDLDIYRTLLQHLIYLRNEYNYCLYCGCQYNSIEDMSSSCPGVMEDGH